MLTSSLRTRWIGSTLVMGLVFVGASNVPGHVDPVPAQLVRHMESHGDSVRFGPFTPQSVETSSAVTVDTNGELLLDRPSGAFAAVGYADLPPVALEDGADTVQIGLDCQPQAGADVFVQVRFKDAETGQLGRWTPTEREGELFLSRPASTVQVRLTLLSQSGHQTPRVRGLIIHMSTALDEDETPDTGVTATIELPTVITRSMWGARPPRDDYNTHDPHTLVVHHTYEPTQAGFAGSSSIRGIQNFHMDSRGWSDIGYHFLVGPDGKLYQGRPDTAVGAHSPPNTGKVGVCLIGNFDSGAESPTAAQRQTLVRVLAHLAGKHGIPVSKIRPHRDFQSTGCPGDTAVGQLPQIREDVAALLQAATDRH